MTRLFIPIGAVVMSLLCSEMSNRNSSNDDVHDLSKFLPVKDIVIDAFPDYLQGMENRLGTLRKDIQDYTKEHRQAIQKVAQTVTAATQESSTNDEEEIKEEADLYDLGAFAGTNFERLCNGEILLTADTQKKLKCRYVDHGIPFLKIAPFKEEEAALVPRIVVYHDVIYEQEIETLKRLSTPKLEKATTIHYASGEEIISTERITETAWISKNEDECIKLLSRRVEHMTCLTIDSAEDLQIGYYEIGGLFLPHEDFFTGSKLRDVQFFTGKTGNRMATVLFYMNDVAKGGATVFPSLNVTLWPKKGSAAFWYNLKRNGEGNELTLHGACPVLSGTKWIATEWLHEEGQELRRPCTLLENE